MTGGISKVVLISPLNLSHLLGKPRRYWGGRGHPPALELPRLLTAPRLADAASPGAPSRKDGRRTWLVSSSLLCGRGAKLRGRGPAGRWSSRGRTGSIRSPDC